MERSSPFVGNYVPSEGIIPPIHGGMEPAWASSDPESAETDVFAIATHFRAIETLPAQGPCQPYASSQRFMLHGWDADTERLLAEFWFDLFGSAGLACGPPSFSDSVSTDDALFFAINTAEKSYLAAKSSSNLDTPATILDLGPAPDRGPNLPSVPSLHGDFASGSVHFGVAGTGVRGWSTDAWRIGLDPWNLTVQPFGIADGPGYPWTLSGAFRGGRGYLHANWNVADLDNFDKTMSADESRVHHAEAEVVLAAVPLDGCFTTDRAVCLNNNRFRIRADYFLTDGSQGAGHARQMSSDSGTFWFFDRDNREVIVKVLDGCGVNGNMWFFAAGLTDVGIRLVVTDLQEQRSRQYDTVAGQPFTPVLDTAAFPCDTGSAANGSVPAQRSATAKSPARSPVVERWRGQIVELGGVAVDPETGHTVGPAFGTLLQDVAHNTTDCGGDTNALCLADGRFRVDLDWTDFQGGTGSAFGGNLTPETGALFFFDESNVEMLVKVLDACAINDRFWLFAGALTNVGVEMTVTDTTTNVAKVYTNLLGTQFDAITDTQSFPCS